MNVEAAYIEIMDHLDIADALLAFLQVSESLADSEVKVILRSHVPENPPGTVAPETPEPLPHQQQPPSTVVRHSAETPTEPVKPSTELPKFEFNSNFIDESSETAKALKQAADLAKQVPTNFNVSFGNSMNNFESFSSVSTRPGDAFGAPSNSFSGFTFGDSSSFDSGFSTDFAK